MFKILIDEIKKLYGKDIKTNQNDVNLWLNCYRGEYPWLGGDNLASLGLAASITTELARLTTIELETEVDSDKISDIYRSVVDNTRRFVEYGLALGGLILKPYYDNGVLSVDYVTPDMFVILAFDNFEYVRHIVFVDRLKKIEGDRPVYYTRLEEHLYDNGWIIKNTAYKSDQIQKLGDIIPLKSVDEWASIDEEAFINADYPLFAYFKNPQANNLDLRDYEGISCFSRALSLIQDADEQYQRILWEYEGSELAIDADVTVLKQSGELPRGKERLFRNLGVDQDEGFYKVFSPEIRDSSLFNGLNKILRRIEFVVGLAYGTLSEVDEVDKTATEVKASKQRSYTTVVDIQKEVEKTLSHLVKVLCFWEGVQEPEISFHFDDSLIVDAETEQATRLQEVAAGILKPEIYLMERYGVTEEEALEMLPKTEKDLDNIDDGIE